jgi:AcrR family transcriptional regulator
MQQQQIQRQEAIFAAAVERFSRQGTEQTTMQEIAEGAGVGKGTLYRYFDDKEDLIFSLIEIGFKKMIDQIKEGIVEVNNPEVKLEKAIEIQLQFYDQHRDFCKFLTRESLGYKDKFKASIKKIRSNYTVVFEEIIDQGCEQEIFKEIDVEISAVSLTGMINITALHWFMFKDDFPVEKIKENLFKIYVSGLKKNK